MFSTDQVNGIKNKLQTFINREKWLQNSLDQAKHQNSMPSQQSNPLNSLVPDLAGVVVRNLTGVPYSGKYARRILRSAQRREDSPVQTQQAQMETISMGHDDLVNETMNFLQTISVKRANLKEPNSQLLVERIRSAQNPAKIETRIRRTVLALERISSYPLIYNKDIQVSSARDAEDKRLTKSLSRFPHLAVLRQEIPEVEPPFREFLRRHLMKQFGNDWSNKVREKFPSQFEKWKQRSSNHKGIDVLDGLQFGELVNILNAFSFLKDKLNNKRETEVSISILLEERPKLIHPSTEAKADIEESKFVRIRFAINTLKDSFR